MAKYWIVSAALLSAACSSAPARMTVDSRLGAAPVILTELSFAQRHQQVSVKQSFLEYAADDGVVIWGGKVENAKSSLSAWPDVNDAGKIVWWPTLAGIARSGDLGFTAGPASFEAGKRFGNYVTIWKKQKDGSWKWPIDLGTRQGIKPKSAPGDPVAIVPVSTVRPVRPDKAWRDLLAVDTDLGRAMARDAMALGERLAPEAQLIGFEAAPAIGAKAARASLGRRPKSFATNPEGGGVSQAGDLGWTYGFANWTDQDGEKRGAYLRVWQRRPSGWLVIVEDIYPL